MYNNLRTEYAEYTEKTTPNDGHIDFLCQIIPNPDDTSGKKFFSEVGGDIAEEQQAHTIYRYIFKPHKTRILQYIYESAQVSAPNLTPRLRKIVDDNKLKSLSKSSLDGDLLEKDWEKICVKYIVQSLRSTLGSGGKRVYWVCQQTISNLAAQFKILATPSCYDNACGQLNTLNEEIINTSFGSDSDKRYSKLLSKVNKVEKEFDKINRRIFKLLVPPILLTPAPDPAKPPNKPFNKARKWALSLAVVLGAGLVAGAATGIFVFGLPFWIGAVGLVGLIIGAAAGIALYRNQKASNKKLSPTKTIRR